MTIKLASVNPENVRNITLPLEVDQIKEFVENKALFFLVDYHNSKLRGASFHAYVGNLELPCDIALGESSLEERFDLLKSYMESRSLNPSHTLRLAVAQILLQYKNYAEHDGFLVNPMLNSVERAEFIAANTEVIERWNTFIASTMLYQLTSIQSLNETFDFKKDFETIEDPRYIGTNVVNLFSIPTFMEIFFSIPCESKIYYFKLQFEEYMFRGKNLFAYFCCAENTLMLIFSQLLSGEASMDALTMLQNEV